MAFASHRDLGQGDIGSPIDEEILKKVNLQPDEELDNFLQQVEEISDVIRCLSSSDPKENERAFRKADILLRDDMATGPGKAGVDVDKLSYQVKANRSVINKVPDDKPKNEGEMGTQAFMRMVEKDANERSKNYKERKGRSDIFRKHGNLMFGKKDFAGALFNYNEAIKLIKDSPCLYNNRALTYLRLGIYSSAVDDCKRCLDLEEFSLRARMFMAKAYFLMGQAVICRATLTEAKEKLPGHLQMINDYECDLFNMGSQDKFEFDLETEKKWKAAENCEFEEIVSTKPAKESETKK